MASNRNVAHAWANQTGRNKKGSNMFYEGPSIYSYGYHFEIARLVGGVVLFNSRRYSVSTSKHQSYTLSACNHIPHFTVPSMTDHNANAEWYLKEIDTLKVSVVRARKNAEYLASSLRGMIDTAASYAARFKPIAPKLRTAIKKLETQAKDGQLFSPREMEKIKAKIEGARKLAREQTERRKKEAEERAAKAIEKLEAWASGQSNELPGYSWDLKLPTRLRINGKRIETSRGAQITLRAAVGLWEAIRNGAHVVGMELDGFTVNAWDGNTLTVGCHNLQAQELDKLAVALNLPARIAQ